MCKISNYPAFYARVEEQLRLEGIPKNTPGHELLKKAIVIYKVDKLPKDKLIEEVEKISLIPVCRAVGNRKENDAEQWMIEAMKSVNIDDDLMIFIEDIANKI